MKTSESIKGISKALLEAQKKMGAAKKDSKNPFFKSNYADLGSVMEVAKPALNDAGIVVVQPACHIDGKDFIVTRLTHSDTGEWMEANTLVVVSKQNDPQAKLAAETYTRRGALQSFVFIPSEDDDGQTAANKPATKTYSTPTPVATASKQEVTNTGTPVVTATTDTTPAAIVANTPVKSSFRKQKPVTTETTASGGDGWNN